MTYIIRNSDKTIKTYTERGDDNVLSAGETIEEISTQFESYANRLKLSLNGRSGETIKVKKGSTALGVQVSAPGEVSIDIAVNGSCETVPLISGVGSINLSAEVAGTYTLTPADTTRYAPAGEAILIVEVAE